MSDELYKDLYKYKLSRKYDVTKSSNDFKMNEAREYSNDMMLKSVSNHIQRNRTMYDVILFMQDLFVTMVKAVSRLKVYKAYAVRKDYHRSK